MISKRASGIIFALLAATCFGSAVPLAGYSYEQGGNVFAYLFCTRIIMAVGLLAICWGKRTELVPDRRFAPLVFTSALIFIIFSILHFSAIQYMPVQLVTMIIFLYPLIVSLFGVVLDKIVPGKIFFLSVVLALMGLYFVLGPEWQMTNWMGNILAFGAAILIAVSLYLNGRILAKPFSPHNPEIFGCQIMVMALLLYLPLTIFVPLQFPANIQGWMAIAAAGLIILGGQVVFFRSITRMGALQVGLYMKIEVVVTLVAATLLLGEKMSLVQMFGAGLVIFALVLNSLDKPVPSEDLPSP